MIRQAVDPQFVQKTMAEVRRVVAAGDVAGPVADAAAVLPAVGDPTAAVLGALPAGGLGPSSSSNADPAADALSVGAAEPFIGRDPVTALLQTTMEERADTSQAVRAPDGLLDLIDQRFGPEDPRWIIDVAAAMLERLAKGNRPFNPEPAAHQITDDARVVIVGDWGSGLPHARDVATFMAQEVADALAHGRTPHVIHLGDVYYSGAASEYDKRVLGPGLWPVTAEQAAANVTSWSLNGNHDMYSGGWAYFDHLLGPGGDERFAAQRDAGGAPTSHFRITSPHWDLVGLDTSWDSNLLTLGQQAVLQDPQADLVGDYVADARQAGRRVVLLSHHQLVSVFDPGDIGKVLPAKLAPILGAGTPIAAWLWGHEHRVMGFSEVSNVAAPRCVGHGGIPVLARTPGPIPPPGTWVDTGTFQQDGHAWARFGFAVLDLDGPRITIRYRDDVGRTIHQETIT